MATKELLEEYTKAMRDLSVFDAIHRDVVKARRDLVQRTEEALDRLKVEARETHEEPHNRYFVVRVQDKVLRSYDGDVLVELFPKVKTFPDRIVWTASDRDLVDQYVKSGEIPKSIAEQAEVSRKMTPAVFVTQRAKFGRPRKQALVTAKQQA